MIYIIKGPDGCNFVYVETREEAINICAETPSLFTWEPLELFSDNSVDQHTLQSVKDYSS
jgi:hypothetical protein